MPGFVAVPGGWELDSDVATMQAGPPFRARAGVLNLEPCHRQRLEAAASPVQLLEVTLCLEPRTLRTYQQGARWWDASFSALPVEPDARPSSSFSIAL